MKIEEEKLKFKRREEKRVKNEQKKILGKDNSRPKLSFAITASTNWINICKFKQLLILLRSTYHSNHEGYQNLFNVGLLYVVVCIPPSPLISSWHDMTRFVPNFWVNMRSEISHIWEIDMTGSNLVRGIGVSRAVSIHDKKAERGHWRENQYPVGWLELTCLGLALQLRSWPACLPAWW